MKTIQFNFKTSFLLLLAGLVLASCSNDDDLEEDSNPPQENNQATTLDCDAFEESNSDAIFVLEKRNDGVDYIIDCVIPVQIDLVIEPGVVIEFTDAAGMKIQEEGSVNALGTEAKPITFTSSQQTKGAWKGIVSHSPSVKNQFTYVNIEYSGADGLSSFGPASLILLADTQFKLNNVTIQNGLNYGIKAVNHNYEVELNNCTITKCEMPFYGNANIASYISGGDFTGNTTDAIRLLSDAGYAQLNSDHTWTDLGVPYRISSTSDHLQIRGGGKLTLQPGVVVEFEDGQGVEIDKSFDDGSAINAVGTSSNPIKFTGATKSPGAWKSIYCYRSTSVQNQFDNVIFEYAGGAGAKGAVEIYYPDPVLSITNSTFKDVSACAIYDIDDEPNPNLVENNNLTENVSGGYLCYD